VAAAIRVVRSVLATAVGWSWQAAAHGPLGSVLSILLALALGGAVFFGGVAGRSAGGVAGRGQPPAQTGLPQTERASAAASSSAGGAPSPASPPLSDRQEDARRLYPARVIYLVDSQADADALRSKLVDEDEPRIQMGGRPRDDMILVAGTEEEREHVADILSHHDGIHASLGLPGIEVIDLRLR
jgi:hypothetical protein